MGQFDNDGKAMAVTFPAGVITFGDLYRIDGWNGVALTSLASGATPRAGTLEIAAERQWYIKTPAAVGTTKGGYLYWTAGTGFKRGDTDLSEAVAGSPVAKVAEVRDANGWTLVRILN